MSKRINNSKIVACMLALGFMAVGSGCTDRDFDLSSIDSTIGLGGDGLLLPACSTEDMLLDDVLDLNNSDFISIADNGILVFESFHLMRREVSIVSHVPLGLWRFTKSVRWLRFPSLPCVRTSIPLYVVRRLRIASRATFRGVFRVYCSSTCKLLRCSLTHLRLFLNVHAVCGCYSGSSVHHAFLSSGTSRRCTCSISTCAASPASDPGTPRCSGCLCALLRGRARSRRVRVAAPLCRRDRRSSTDGCHGVGSTRGSRGLRRSC